VPPPYAPPPPPSTDNSTNEISWKGNKLFSSKKAAKV